MKRLIFWIVFILSVAFLTASCGSGSRKRDEGSRSQQNQSTTTASQSGGHDAHDHETEALSFTFFSGDYELFVEFPPLVAGEPVSFAAHFTRLSDYKPVTAGQLELTLHKEVPVVKVTACAPSSPGIFRPSLIPQATGDYSLIFDLTAGDTLVRFEILDIRVYSDLHEAAHAHVSSDEEHAIVYLKEQAWKTDFATEEVNRRPFYEVIHTAAEVKYQPQADVEVTSPAAGTVNLLVVLGQQVKQGEPVAMVTASGIENNLQVRLSEYRIAWEKSRADYLRTKSLAENRIVSQKDFLEIKSRFQQDSLRYFQMAGSVTEKGLTITAPVSGYISGILIPGGAYTETGTPVVSIGNSRQLLMVAYVNQSDYGKAQGVFDARFRLPSGDGTVTLSELNGQVKSSQAFVPGSSTRIPVTMTVTNNGLLIPGMTVEAFLFTGKKEQALVIPLSALVEELGQYYVFVQTGGESFVKRPVRLAGKDGRLAEATSPPAWMWMSFPT